MIAKTFIKMLININKKFIILFLLDRSNINENFNSVEVTDHYFRNMDISFKKYKKSSTYYRKLKLASEKYRFMFNKLHVKRNTARNPVLSAAVRKATVAGMKMC